MGKALVFALDPCSGRRRNRLHRVQRQLYIPVLKLAPAVRALPQEATGAFKDSYLVDFLDLPESHSESDLQTGLLRNLRSFLMELGDDFAFVGKKVRVQVGNQDFELGLRFYHRDLQCLVACELKTVRFEREHMGKLAFYLEALDRDRRRTRIPALAFSSVAPKMMSSWNTQ